MESIEDAHGRPRLAEGDRVGDCPLHPNLRGGIGPDGEHHGAVMQKPSRRCHDFERVTALDFRLGVVEGIDDSNRGM